MIFVLFLIPRRRKSHEGSKFAMGAEQSEVLAELDRARKLSGISPEPKTMRHFLSIAALMAAISVSRANDVVEFLKPDNWKGLPGLWTIDKQVITGKTDKDLKFNTFFCTQQKYANFELGCRVRIKEGKGNSGIQVRSAIVEKEKDRFVVAGPQADMGQQYWGSLYGEKFGKDGTLPGAGHMLKACPGDFVKNHVKAGDFNDYFVSVRDKKVEITVNGKTAVKGEFEILPSEGIIALQLHAGGPMEVTFEFTHFKKLP